MSYSLISKKDKEKIKSYSLELIDKMLKKSFEKDGKKRIAELDDKILKLFSKSEFDQIKTEINLLFSEVYDNSSDTGDVIKKKITDLLSKVDKKNKEDILEITNTLLSEILQREFNKELKKNSSEIEELLNSDSFDKLKEKLFDLIKKTAELDKLSIK
ncbi:hypothetical protein [Mycoplasma mycoides]|uniref:hypothetical protein n=1 Tax=Mycoplasma mycoides TaxID=2102 RepID=UPI00224086D1|nr:hypothetical protein [Mycoplasma mycoides]QVK07223.1 hypothetical protein I7642_02065 [Mycoplasma mycoides subsp. capri]